MQNIKIEIKTAIKIAINPSNKTIPHINILNNPIYQIVAKTIIKINISLIEITLLTNRIKTAKVTK